MADQDPPRLWMTLREDQRVRMRGGNFAMAVTPEGVVAIIDPTTHRKGVGLTPRQALHDLDRAAT